MEKKAAYKLLYELKNTNPDLFSKKIGKLSKEDVEYFAAIIILELNKNKNSEVVNNDLSNNKSKYISTKKIINPQVTYRIDKKI